MRSFCGLDCSSCEWKEHCKGCRETMGKPFGGDACPLAKCCCDKKQDDCAACGRCALKNQLIAEFNALHISGMPEIQQLYALAGSIVNMEYPLLGGQKAKFWKDENIYLGTQVEKEGSHRCFGLAADENYLMVSEYGENGADAEIVIFRKR